MGGERTEGMQDRLHAETELHLLGVNLQDAGAKIGGGILQRGGEKF